MSYRLLTSFGPRACVLSVLIHVAMFGLTARHAMAQTIDWNSGGASSAFTDSQNWNPNTVPGPSDVAVIGTGATGGNQATIGSGQVANPGDLHVWTGAGDGGVLNVEPGGVLNITNDLRVETEVTPDGCCWIPDDRDTDAVVHQTGGTVTVGANFHLGRDNLPPKGIYNLSGGTLDVVGRYFSGDAANGEPAETGSAVMNISGDAVMTVQSTGGNSGVAGQFNISGNGTVVFGNPDERVGVGGSNFGDGLIHIQDNGSLTINGNMEVAFQQFNGDVNDAEFRMEGGTATLDNVMLGGWHAEDMEPQLGREKAFFNLSNGTATATGMDVGGFPNSHGELNVSGGSLQISGTTQVGRDNYVPFDETVKAEGFVNVSAGSVHTTDLVVGVAAVGTVNQTGGNLTVDNSLILGQGDEGQGTFNLTGGTLDLTGGTVDIGAGDATFNFDGGTILDAATINLDLVNNGGTLSPGSPAGTTSITGDYLVVSTDAALDIELGGTGAGQFDRVAVTGEILADGALNVALVGGYSPVAGDSFDILDFASLTGAFAGVNLPSLGGGLAWDDSQLLTTGVLSVVGGAAPELQAGDADQDLDFDQFDLVMVQQAAKYLTGESATWGEGDWNGAPGGSQGSPPAGDGLFNQLDIVASLTAGKYLTGPYAAIADGGTSNDEQTSVVYDVGTGELRVDAPASTELTSINIDSAAGIFTGDAAANLGGSFDNDADNNIFKATFGGSFGSLSFGNVAQPGLTKEFVLNDLSVVGSLAGGGDLGEVDLVYIPEPSSLTLLGIWGAVGLLTILRVRRGR